MLNRVTLIGRLGKDPEVRRLESGAAVAKFSLATSESYKDKEGNLWFGTRNGGIYKYDYNKFVNIADSKNGEQIAMASVLEDKEGTIWIASFARKGVYKYDGNSFIPLDIIGNEKLNDIKFISEDVVGNIWFGGRYGLLWRFDEKELKDFTQLKRMK